MKLTTDFIKIGQSGPTADGRTIGPQWLRDAAETYDPKMYTALIWPDHFRFLGNSGKVVALEAREEGEVVGLFARLQPNARLLQSIKEGQRLYTSMELAPNFADSGKHYLAGLGVTDSPASLGTDELKFSQRKQQPENLIVCGVELGEAREEGAAHGDDEPPAWVRKFLQRIFPPKDAPASASEEPETDEENAVEKEQFEALSKQLGDLTSQVEELGEKFTAQSEDATGETDAAKHDGAPEQDAASKEIFDKLDALANSFNELKGRMEQAAPGTSTQETTGPADASGCIV